jgi:hypothetical protein
MSRHGRVLPFADPRARLPGNLTPAPSVQTTPTAEIVKGYPTPTADPADLPVFGKLINSGAVLDRHHSAVGIG